MTTPATDEQIAELLTFWRDAVHPQHATRPTILSLIARIEEDRREIERLRQLRASIDAAFAGHKGCAPYDLDCGVGADIALILKDYDDDAGREKR